jgi:HAD superfamily hydrolase (TIGR01509 family)
MKALIFDMDGLMIDSERLYFQAEREIAARFGKNVDTRTLWKMMGRKPIESIKIFVAELNLPEKPEKILDMRDEIMKEKLRIDLKPMPGLFEIIRLFHKRLDLAVATGATQEFLDIVVGQLGIREMFSVLQASDEITRGKPDPEIYKKTCQKLSLKPVECMVLEDSANGIQAAKRAGCYTIAVPSEYTREQDFGPADFVADGLPNALDHINAQLAVE